MKKVNKKGSAQGNFDGKYAQTGLFHVFSSSSSLFDNEWRLYNDRIQENFFISYL